MSETSGKTFKAEVRSRSPAGRSRSITDPEKRCKIKGKGIVPGTSTGSSFVYADILSRDREMYPVSESDVSREMRRIRDAFTRVGEHLLELENSVESEVGREHSLIFRAHRSIIEDPELLADIEEKMHKLLLNGETVIREVFYDLVERFRSLDSSEMKERAADLEDLLKRILRELRGIEAHILEDIEPDTVIFARQLLPSDTIHLDRGKARAIVTEKGSSSSHAAILAKALGIPYVTCIDISLQEIPSGKKVVVNGEAGTVIVNPTLDEYREAEQKRTSREKLSDEEKERILKAPVLFKGDTVKIYANISSRADAEEAARNGADGIGLFRVENIYLGCSEMPAEAFLAEKMAAVLEPVQDMDIVIRLLDIGGDKLPPYLMFDSERNGQLGLRGVRILLEYRDLLETQLSACIKLADDFSINILIPMITLPEEITAVKEVFQKLRYDSRYSGSLPFGAMIETPAAYLQLGEILGSCEFVSVGSNDLIQYIMAAGREQYEVSEYYEKGKPIIIDLLHSIVHAARNAGAECTLCGELGGEDDYLRILLETGLRNISVSPGFIPGLKKRISEYTN